jgi:small-conductance mechanosensitive channel
MPDWLTQQFLGNSVSGWLIAGGGVLLAVGVVTLLRSSLVRRLEAASARTETVFDDYLVVLLKSLRPTFVVLGAVAWALLSLDIPAGWVLACRWLLVLAMVLQTFRWVNKTIEFWVASYEQTHGAAVDRAAVSIISFGVRLAFWVLIGLEVLRYFHKSPTALLGTLGVSGIALALAVQNVLGDLLAALAILLDKPFVVGDSITIDNFEGVVEKIGLKTTRLRALTGEQVIFSNSDMMRSRMRNLTRRWSRRFTVTVSVAPGTPVETLSRIPAMITELVATLPHASLVRAHLMATTPVGFDFEAVVGIDTVALAVVYDARQALLLGLLTRFEREGIRLAQGALATQLPRLDTEIR